MRPRLPPPSSSRNPSCLTPSAFSCWRPVHPRGQSNTCGGSTGGKHTNLFKSVGSGCWLKPREIPHQLRRRCGFNPFTFHQCKVRPILLLSSWFTSYTRLQVLKGLKLHGRRNSVAILDPSRLPARKNTPDRHCEVQVAAPNICRTINYIAKGVVPLVASRGRRPSHTQVLTHLLGGKTPIIIMTVIITVTSPGC